jgi:formylglycine-generating enzyme required for sulfatase activity
MQLLETYECTRCHRLTTPHRLIGPSLWKLGERADAAAIRASLLTPDAIVVPSYPAGLMRTRLEDIGFYRDIARQPGILEDLVAFLAGNADASTAPARPQPARPGMIQIAPGPGRLPSGEPADIPAFTIDATPVTNTQYAAFIAAGGYITKSYWERAGWAVVVQRNKRTQPAEWSSRHTQFPESPVVGVSWYEAAAYCRWSGKTWPSEVQWERACQEVPEWYGPHAQPGGHWEWTAEAVWKGHFTAADSLQLRCAARTSSYPALDNQHTSFRCGAPASPTAP